MYGHFIRADEGLIDILGLSNREGPPLIDKFATRVRVSPRRPTHAETAKTITSQGVASGERSARRRRLR